MTFDIAVVGLGPIGSAALREAAEAGATVIGIGVPEPSPLEEHSGPFASHHDAARITRRLDASPVWADLARRSIEAYPRLQQRSGIEFHRGVGVLWVSTHPSALGGLQPVASQLEIDATVLPLGDRQVRHVSLPGDAASVLEGGPAGMVDPRGMVGAQLAIARAEGAELISGEVTGWHEDSARVRLETRGGPDVDASTVILAAGAYTGFLAGLDEVPIVPTTEAVLLGEVSPEVAAELGGLPALIHQRGGGEDPVDVYLLPPVEYPNGRWYVKLGAENAADATLDSPAEVRRWMSGSHLDSRRRLLGRALGATLADVEFLGYEIKPCVYARTPSRLPFVDHLSTRVVVAAGGNGRAAKSSDALGSLAARLALTGDWDDPLPSTAFALPL